MATQHWKIEDGFPAPLGVHIRDGGVNIAVASHHGTQVSISLFTHGKETARLKLPRKTGGVFHGFVPCLKAGQHYGLRVDGIFDPGTGLVFDHAKLLLDPYATRISKEFSWADDLAVHGKDSAALVPHGIIEEPLGKVVLPKAQQPHIIYEVSVKALTTLHPDVPEALRGTVGALAHESVIAHFRTLGVDTIELMPLMAWIDERHLARAGLNNAWGYNPVSFFAPDPRLAPGGMAEIQRTLQALHDAGFQIILDVVFNHSGESDLGGATISFRGLDNPSYYALHNGALINDTGCGNTLALQNPLPKQLVLDALRYWREVAGFDGFRYDLAPVMGRSAEGYSKTAPLLLAMEEDAVLRDCLHIAEPWDIGPGGYQLGQFPAGWSEWNDRYRDDVRHFWRGDGRAQGGFATRLSGSADIFNQQKRLPSASINFVAAHDGFALEDVVQFSTKQNFANGENNRDGNSSEASWISPDPERDVRAMLATLFVSRGTPMLMAGDEFGRSQNGNNNAYAQDNEVTWLNWVSADRDRLSYTTSLINFRREHAAYFADRFLTGENLDGGLVADAAWFNQRGQPMAEPDWASDHFSVLALALAAAGRSERLLLLFNRGHGVATTPLPEPQDGMVWRFADLVFEPDNTLNENELALGQRCVCCLIEVKSPLAKRRRADDAMVAQLAVLAGIQPEWWEVNGTNHQVSMETKRHLLSALGFPLQYAHDVLSSISERLAEIDKFAAAPVQEAFCYLPETLINGERQFGVGTHLYALRDERDFGIGDFTTLEKFSVGIARNGGSFAGINPLHHMFPQDRDRVSPYQPSDRRFIDPIYIAVDHHDTAEPLRGLTHVDYGQVWAEKEKILRKMFQAKRTVADEKALQSFISVGGFALQHHGKFEGRGNATEGQFAIWLQWIADRQLGAAAQNARTAGLQHGLYRDLALGCAYEGGELQSDPQLFCADVSIGSPPDPFSADGQVWNLPPYNPLELQRRNFTPYGDVLAANMRHAGILRIDHVLGLARQFWVPRGASGSQGAYLTMPLDRLMALVAATSQAHKCVVIGEDLGTVPDGLRQKMAAINMLSYKMLWFEREGHAFKAPHTYPRLALSCLSSHDLLPFRGWQMTAATEEQNALNHIIHDHPDPMVGAHGAVAAGPAMLMQIQADDLTEETSALNIPGTDQENPNWRRRLSVSVEHLFTGTTAKSVIATVKQEQDTKP